MLMHDPYSVFKHLIVIQYCTSGTLSPIANNITRLPKLPEKKTPIFRQPTTKLKATTKQNNCTNYQV